MKNTLANQLAQKWSFPKNSRAYLALLEFSKLSNQHERRKIRSLARTHAQIIKYINRRFTDERQGFWEDE
jgi:hypothetical protein